MSINSKSFPEVSGISFRKTTPREIGHKTGTRVFDTPNPAFCLKISIKITALAGIKFGKLAVAKAPKLVAILSAQVVIIGTQFEALAASKNTSNK